MTSFPAGSRASWRSRTAVAAYWITGGLTAVLFVFPLIWTLIRSLQTSKAFLGAPT